LAFERLTLSESRNPSSLIHESANRRIGESGNRGFAAEISESLNHWIGESANRRIAASIHRRAVIERIRRIRGFEDSGIRRLGIRDSAIQTA
jgi:hypothetical protein